MILTREETLWSNHNLMFRNLSFDTTNEALKEHFSCFGEVTLAVMCKFSGTDQATGNAFVHFKDRESADKCLEELEAGLIHISMRLLRV